MGQSQLPAKQAVLINKGRNVHLNYRLKNRTQPHALGLFTIKDLSVPLAARSQNPQGTHYFMTLNAHSSTFLYKAG